VTLSIYKIIFKSSVHYLGLLSNFIYKEIGSKHSIVLRDVLSFGAVMVLLKLLKLICNITDLKVQAIGMVLEILIKRLI
jgi:hypothetical protein